MFKMAAACHIEFLEVRHLTVRTLRRANVRHKAKYHTDRPSFDFSRWRPSAILDLFYACLDHSQRDLLVFATEKFGLNQCSSFDNMQVLIV